MKIQDKKKPAASTVKATAPVQVKKAVTASALPSKKFGNEFSTGQAKALRVKALKAEAFGVVKLAATAKASTSTAVDPAVQEALENTRNGSDVGYFVKELNPTQRAQYVAELAKDPSMSDLLLAGQNPVVPLYGYTAQEGEAISKAMGDAYKQGLITADTLSKMAEEGPKSGVDTPNRPMRLAALLGLAPANSGVGGINDL